MEFDLDRVREKIEQALLAQNYEETQARNIAFHMTDWLRDLGELNDFYSKPDGYSNKEVEELLIRFLVHVPNHLAAAAKVLVGFGSTDVFGVGAVGDEVHEDGEEEE